MGILIMWIIFSIFVGLIGKNKSTGFLGAFFLSILFSPIIGLIIVLVSSKAKPPTIINCDGCRKVIKGQYINIAPKGTKEEYNYCSTECRNEYHPRYMKEKGIDWVPLD